MSLHPQVVDLIAELTARTSVLSSAVGRPLAELTPAELRAQMAALRDTLGEGPAIAELRDLQISTPSAELPARLYRGADADGAALWVWFHGGGCVLGQVEDQDAICQLMALRSGCDVLSVGYRLAPEHPFPAAATDAYQAVAWASDALAQGRPLLVGGDSAGGNLAAVAALQAREHGGPPIALQVLVYPMLDHDFDTASYRAYGGDEHLLPRELMMWFWDHYAPDAAQRESPLAAPLRAPDLAGLPPAVVVLAGYDPLRDEGRAYARRLEEAGVPVDLLHYDDVIHGFWAWGNRLDRGVEAVDAVAGLIRRTLAHGPGRAT